MSEKENEVRTFLNRVNKQLKQQAKMTSRNVPMPLPNTVAEPTFGPRTSKGTIELGMLQGRTPW